MPFFIGGGHYLKKLPTSFCRLLVLWIFNGSANGQGGFIPLETGH
jgi:hypothetical protein